MGGTSGGRDALIYRGKVWRWSNRGVCAGRNISVAQPKVVGFCGFTSLVWATAAGGNCETQGCGAVADRPGPRRTLVCGLGPGLSTEIFQSPQNAAHRFLNGPSQSGNAEQWGNLRVVRKHHHGPGPVGRFIRTMTTGIVCRCWVLPLLGLGVA